MAPDEAGAHGDGLQIQRTTLYSLIRGTLPAERASHLNPPGLRRGSLVLLAGLAVGRVVTLSDASSSPSSPSSQQAGGHVLKAVLTD